MSQAHVSSDVGVRLAPDGIGKTVRTLDITVMLADGSTGTVEMQVISIADKTGAILDFSGLEHKLDRLVDLTRHILEHLEANA